MDKKVFPSEEDYGMQLNVVDNNLEQIFFFSLQQNFYRPSLRNVEDLAYEFNIPEGLRVSAAVGVVERS